MFSCEGWLNVDQICLDVQSLYDPLFKHGSIRMSLQGLLFCPFGDHMGINISLKSHITDKINALSLINLRVVQ